MSFEEHGRGVAHVPEVQARSLIKILIVFSIRHDGRTSYEFVV
jgi:hypothetical protein